MNLKSQSRTLLQDFMAIFDKEGICMSTSNEWNQLFNIEGDSKGKRIENLLDEDLADQFYSHFSHTIAHQIPNIFSLSLEHLGETIHGICTMKPWFLEHSELGGVLILIEIEDYDLQKLRQSEVPQFNEKQISYNILIENMRNMVCLHKPDATYYYVSPSFKEILGYAPEELIGKDPYDFFHPDDRPIIREKAHNPSLKGAKETEIEYRFKHKDGHYVWIHTLTRPLKESGKVYALQTDSYSVQERKELEIRLRQSEEQFRGAFEHSAIGMALVAPDGKWIKTNQRLRDMLGYDVDELSAMTFHDITHPEDLQKDTNLLKEFVKGKINTYQLEKRYFHKNGQVVWVFLAASMVRKPTGEPKHFISQIMDITERKKAEQELQQLLTLTSDQNDRLVNFAHIVSHNLRSHSSNIKMLLDLLDDESSQEERQSIIQMLTKASTNLENTISNLNEIVSKQSHRHLDMKAISLKHSIQKTCANLEALILKNYAIIKNEVPEEVKIMANPAYMDSILLNLITNAIKYASPDKNPVILFTSKQEGNRVMLSVRDNGVGIDLKKHGKDVFKLHQTFHGNADAKGIGLFITKNQVEAMGGKIDLKSKLGKGTEFILELIHA